VNRNPSRLKNHLLAPQPSSESARHLQKTCAWGKLSLQFISSLDAKPATIDLYRKGLGYFLDWLKSDQPGRQDILEYKKSLLEHQLKPFTVNAYLTSVRQFFAWLEAEKLYPDVAKAVKGVTQPRIHAKDSLRGSQSRRLIDSVELDGIISRRDYAILNLMLRTGLRTIEVSRANIGDIRNKGEDTVLYIQGKGRLRHSHNLLRT
jgi:integrase/recombinase XerD